VLRIRERGGRTGRRCGSHGTCRRSGQVSGRSATKPRTQATRLEVIFD
jgi:hypothetical protein